MADSYDPDAVTAAIKRGLHREVVGGMWTNSVSFNSISSNRRGLKPLQTLLDVGCGSLRGGVKFIPYLDPGRYWGIDKDSTLPQVGWDIELTKCSRTNRQPREQLICLDNFQFSSLGTQFDYAIAQSVLTHLSLNRIRRYPARGSTLDGRLYR